MLCFTKSKIGIKEGKIMDVDLSDIHDSHGLVFTLNITEEGTIHDASVISGLKGLLKGVANEDGGGTVLYVYD